MTDPRYAIGDRVTIVGNTPWSGYTGEVRQVNPSGYFSGVYDGQNIYSVRLDGGANSIQTERNLELVPTKRRRRA
jgi:hypothetical protein